MKVKKICLISLLTLLSVILVAFFCSCNKEESTVEKEQFIFTLSQDGLSYAVRGGIKYNSKNQNLIIPSTYNSLPVAEIMPSAFANSKYVSAEVPEGVKTINSNAFSLSKIESITLPESLTEIGQQAFWGSKIKSITIPSQIKEIKDSVFWSCDKLADVKLPNGLETIGNNAFSGCQALTEIVLPDGVEQIGRYAFSTTGIEKINQPQNLSYVGYNVLNNTPYYLDKNNWKDGKLFFGNFLIEDNTEIPLNGTYVIDQDAVGIADELFFDKYLKRVYIHDRFRYVGKQTFGKCDQLMEFFVDDANPYFTVKDGHLYDKDLSVLFYYCNGQENKTFQVPSSVKRISDYAFYDNRKLTEITLPDGLKEIGLHAFTGCTSLTEILIPNGVTCMEENRLSGCDKLLKVTLPESLTAIYNRMFSGCRRLKEVIIPENVTYIGEDAFYNCESITQIVMPTSVVEIGSGAFSNCINLTSVKISENVEIIEAETFANCESLFVIVLPDKCRRVDERAFYNCTSLERVYMGKEFNFLVMSAFEGCNNLILVELPHTDGWYWTQYNNYDEIPQEQTATPEKVAEYIMENIDRFYMWHGSKNGIR